MDEFTGKRTEKLYDELDAKPRPVLRDRREELNSFKMRLEMFKPLRAVDDKHEVTDVEIIDESSPAPTVKPKGIDFYA